MSKTIVIPVGEPEHMLEVVLSDTELVRIVMDTMSARGGAIVPANPDVSPVPLTNRFSGMERDFHLATAVARLMALTGRNLRDPDAGVPFGHVREGQPRANTMTTNRDSSRPIRGRPSLLSFLEDEEPDTGERYLSAPVADVGVSNMASIRPRTSGTSINWTQIYQPNAPSAHRDDALLRAGRERDLRTVDEISRQTRQLRREIGGGDTF